MEQIFYKTNASMRCLTECPYIKNVLVGTMDCYRCEHSCKTSFNSIYIECSYLDDYQNKENAQYSEFLNKQDNWNTCRQPILYGDWLKEQEVKGVK